MRVSRLRLGIAVAGLAVLGMVGSAHGATGPSTLVVTDPAGDSRGGQASLDIKQVVFTTTGKTATKVIKRKRTKVYTADTLVVKMVLAAPPTDAPAVVYEVDSLTKSCGTMYLYYDPEQLASGGFTSNCDAPDAAGRTNFTIDVTPVVKGSTITWSMPLRTLPKQMGIGSTITDIESYIAVSEPLTGASPALVTTSGNFDTAESGKVYKIG